MPELPRYQVHRTPEPLPVDGTLTHPAWADAAWTGDFVDIRGDRPAPPYRTRAKLLYDDTYLYLGAELEEPHVWSTLTRRNAPLFEQNNFELFLDPDGDRRDYYEFEINPLGTIWELSLTAPYAEGGVAVDPDNLPGLRTAVHVEGTVNDPGDTDTGWRVEAAFPWTSLARFHQHGSPPVPGDTWRMNLMRVEWHHEVVDGEYRRADPAEFWVWAPQYAVDMHRPEHWGVLEFGGGQDVPCPHLGRPDPAG